MKYLSLLALAFAVASAAPVEPPKHTTLTECLAVNDVPMIESCSTAWDATVKPFNLRKYYKPAVVTVPATVRDVQESVNCAREYNVKVQARGGGHSYAAMGLGGKDGSLVIDMHKFKSLTYNTTKKEVTVGAGVRLGDMADWLYNKAGKRALPHGLCPSVGIAGHALHGGFGMTSRMWGTTLDSITEMQVVLADGSHVTTSTTKNPDLFWALRGAGSSYGIVTSFTLKTQDAPKVATYYQYNYYSPSISIKTKVIEAMQTYGATADKKIALRLFFNNDTFQVYGAYWGPKREWQDKIKGLLDLLPIAGRVPSVPGDERQWLNLLVDLNNGGSLNSTAYTDFHETFFAKSIVTPANDHLKEATIKNFFTYLATDGAVAPVNWWVIFDLYGGGDSQISKPDISTTSYAHRNTLFTLQIYSTAPGQVPPYPAGGYPFVDGIVDSITEYQNGTDFRAYANYIDPTLTKEQAWDLYYGPQMPKLNRVKDAVDPKRVFWNPQAIRA